MSTSIHPSGRPTPNSRRVPRCPLSVPVRVTMQNTGGIQGIPGRSLNLGEGGIAAILAGMVSSGSSVGVEFLLPEMGLSLHAKAVVRHQADLRCGLEFVSLSLEQQAMIRRWIRRMLEKPGASPAMSPPATAIEPDGASHNRFQVPLSPAEPDARFRYSGKWMGRILLALGIVAVAVSLAAWGYWHMEWVELQQQADAVSANSAQRVNLPPGAIELLTVHKVDAVLPEGQPEQNAVALLHIVVAADGTVIDARAENGTELFNRAAMDAVKEWRFQPYRVNGAPVEIETTVAVAFR